MDIETSKSKNITSSSMDVRLVGALNGGNWSCLRIKCGGQ